MIEMQLLTFYEIHLESRYFATTNHNILIDQCHNSSNSSKIEFLLQASASVNKEGCYAQLLDTQCKVCLKLLP